MADSILDSLTPEQLAALLQGSTLEDESSLLQQQLAELLGPTEHRQYSTPLGAGLGGIAEALDGTVNAFHAKALRGDQRKNLDAQAKLKGDFGALLRGPQDPAAGFELPFFERPPEYSAPPLLDVNAPLPADGMMPEIDLTVPTSAPITPGTDVSAFPEVANAHLPRLRKGKRGSAFSF